ncbi:conjugal transfer protein TraO [Aquimarina agarivorans]|uniref:conjugal transfer protein TraO n=1 Tax=Aquimarina agarivorans TaxID=980584 RepID=UPI000248ED1A|nr:conjugal transfer protein TraO [Aquimarina agarivorans]
MLKKSLSTFFILVLFTNNIITAQENKAAISINGGIVQGGFGGSVNFNYLVNKNDFIEIGVLGSFSNAEVDEIKVPIQLYAANIGFFYNLFRNKAKDYSDLLADSAKKIDLAIGIGGSVGQETLNDNDPMINERFTINSETETIVFGGFIGIDANYYINSKFMINLKINEFYHANSEIGKLSAYAGLGFKFRL